MMRLNDRSPLFIALAISLLLCAGASLALYLNEDWRQTTFGFLEEVVNEEGEVVKKVKVEKPEPNREQVREISRNQEIKKREKLKENARKLRKTIIELEEVVDARVASLETPDIWDEMSKRANALKEQAEMLRFWQSKHRYLSSQPGVREESTHIRDQMTAHANQMRVIALQAEANDDDTWAALDQIRKIIDELAPLQEALRNAYLITAKQADTRETGKIERYIMLRIDEFKQLKSDSTEYLKDFENLLMQGDLGTAEDMAALPDSKLPETEDSGTQEDQEDTESETSAVDEALAAMEDAEETLADASSDEEVAEASPKPKAEDSLPTEEDLENMETAELYESIQEMTEQLDESYAENKAAELAEFKQLSLEEAKEQVYAPKTDTGPELSEELSKNQPNTSEEFKAFNEALDQAVSSSERMTRQAESRLDSASGKQSDESKASQTAEQLREALSKDATTKAKMAMAASNMGHEDGNLQDLRSLMNENYANAQGSHSGGGGGSSGTQHAGLSTHYDASSFTGADRSGNNPDKISLNRDRTFAQALPGRRFDMQSERKGWIFIDTWYIIGPWDLPSNVKEFEPSLPPETTVDLDETYEGKAHPVTKQPMELEWRFTQSGVMRIKPPDEMSSSVYFAYTEVFCESAMDVVVAVASDDRAKLWINDMVVFQDVGLSGWRLDEGFRRILLKPGYNKLLVRLENGPSFTNFSVLMCPF
ncbi:MAG: hypothetical protein CML13_05755, partial [Puniceicoccaceae bacterium]|nr:hypothetical protein [Puniceicoccaceae bacterium]